MSPKRLLLVEDDRSLGQTLKERLEKESYRVDWCKFIRDALQMTATNKYDLVILDVGLPDGSGYDLAKSLKQKTAAPFIFVTAQTTAEQRLLGYELGAEEYVPKPFHLKELLLRVRHVLENHAAKSVVRCGDVIIDFDRRAVITNEGQSESLAQRDYAILKLLVDRAPAAVSRDDILNQVWGEDQFPTQRTIDNAILRLRQILGPRAGQYIKTIRGVGYQWVMEENDGQ